MQSTRNRSKLNHPPRKKTRKLEMIASDLHQLFFCIHTHTNSYMNIVQMVDALRMVASTNTLSFYR